MHTLKMASDGLIVKMYVLCKDLLMSPKYINIVFILLLALECCFLPLIIWKVSYTEIDWTAYMQEVEGFLNGTTDYHQLKGDTGPLVYPAGFLYIFSFLYAITGQGSDIILAQYIFALLYIINLSIVFRIYYRISKDEQFPAVLCVFLSLTAYRVHSIFVLRCFNDAVAVSIFHLSLLLFISNKWTLGSIIYSVAVSVKMNIMLYSPGLLVLFLKRFSFSTTIKLISYCAIVQLLLGAPFLLTHPLSYIGRAFDLGRVFLYKWTVNWRFLPEGLFLSRSFHALLLLCHVGSLVVFAATKWMSFGSFKKSFPHKQSSTISPQEVLYIMFTSNFIGICFSRSLHFQFYVWYFYSLPMLVYWSQLPIIISVLLLFTLEYSWNVYPSTTLSSLLLHLVHFVIFVRLLSLPRPSFMSDYKIKTIDKKY